MPGLVPGIHVLAVARRKKAWMAGTSPAMTTARLSVPTSRSEMPVADFGDEIDEGAHLGRQQPRGRIDDVDRQRRLLEFLQHYPEPPGLDRFRRLIGQHPRQAAALLGILDRGVGTVGGETRRARHANLSAMLDKVPVRRGGRGAELYRLVGSDHL